jgi:geranylgeranyl diphosphate synthase type II
MTTDQAPLVETVQSIKVAIEDALDHHLPRDSELAPDLVAAMRYSALGSGKRIRPLLVCAATLGVGGHLEDALAPACALEFIHAYSLIHDDLPAMDDDDLRHGLPSCHVRFGQATAILAGDALQTLAFTTLTEAPAIESDTKVQALRLLSNNSGWKGMVGGQARDMSAEGEKLSLTELQALHSAKTGALITASVQIGALVGGATSEQFVLLTEFANRIGLAFQVIDDVLDMTQSTEHLGKPAGSDTKADKNTYPALMGLIQAQEHAEALLMEALPLLDRAKVSNPLLANIAESAVRRTK